jgi:hypothetical protein
MTASQRAQIVSFGGEMNFDALIPIRPIERSPVGFIHGVLVVNMDPLSSVENKLRFRVL